jgi:hypothetical protein
VTEIGDFEPGCADRVQRGPVAVAAVADPRLEPVEPVLPPGQALVVGADMLDEQEASAGPEHPAQFAQRARLVVDCAQDEGGDDHVEAVVLEREILGGGAQEPNLRRTVRQSLLQAAHHGFLGLGQGQRLDPVVEVKVCAGSASDLEHAALGLRD